MTVEDSKLLSGKAVAQSLSVVGKAQSLEDSLSTIHSLDTHRSNGKPLSISLSHSLSLSLYLTLSLYISLSLYITLTLSLYLSHSL